MDNVSHFLIDLAVNPKQQQAFAKEPVTVMTKVGLSEADQMLLTYGNQAQVSATLADEFFKFAFMFGDPNPDPWPDPDPPMPDDSDSEK